MPRKTPNAPEVARGARAIAKRESSRLTLDRQGRLVIPADLREQLQLQAGDELSARVAGGRLVLEPRRRHVEEIVARWKGAFGRASGSSEISREREREAKREDKRGRRA